MAPMSAYTMKDLLRTANEAFGGQRCEKHKRRFRVLKSSLALRVGDRVSLVATGLCTHTDRCGRDRYIAL